MKRLIVVGPLPPPAHGVTVSTSLILANSELRARFAVEHLDTSDHRDRGNVGRWEVRNGLYACSALARLRTRLSGPRGVVYLPLSQGLPGLTRDMLLVRIAARARWRVAVHLRGGEIDLVVRAQPRPVQAWLRRGFERVDAVAVLGESLRHVFDGLVAAERLAVVPNGTPDPGPPQPRDNGVVGLFLSNLRRRKGVVEAMEAAVRVTRERPEVRFVFAGACADPQLWSELEAMAEPAGDRIELRDAVGAVEKHALLAEASFLLFCPREPEGHPRVVLEGMAAGLPVIATDRGAIAETLAEGSGVVLPEPDPAALADEVLALVDDRPRLLAMATAARDRYERRYTEQAADRALADWLDRVAAD